MRLRLAASGLALAVLVFDWAEADRVAFDLLLVAVVLAAVAGLEAVAAVVDGRRSRTSAILAGLALLSLVAAGAMRTPELVLGCLACYALDRVQLRIWLREPRGAESR